MPTVLAVLALLLFVPPAFALDAFCGMVVPAGETVVMTSDLTCENMPIGISLGAKATLDMNGFTMNVGAHVVGIFCEHLACTVVSTASAPGVLEGNGIGFYGLVSNLQPQDRPPIRKLVIDNIVIRNMDSVGMYAAFFGKSLLSRLFVTGCGGPGIIGRKMVLNDVTVTNNGIIWAGGGDGIVASKVTGANVQLSDNFGSGLFLHDGGSVSLRGLVASGNAVAGIEGRGVRLIDSQLFDNPIDIDSLRRPNLKNSSCQTSTWDVCALD